MKPWNYLLEVASRRKTIRADTLHETSFKRCMNTLDLAAIGMGFGTGLGVYVVASKVARDEAGPATVISFIIAGVTALLCGLCYCECATRLPRAGSAYLYTYTVLGELAAFVVGWTMVLEYILVGAVSGKAWGQYLDYLLDGQIEKALSKKFLLHLGPYLEDHLDLPAFSILIAVVFLSALLAKSLAVLVFLLGIVSVLVVMAIVCVGFFHVESENWKEPPGFFAYGMLGVLRGAGACVVSFIGIDAIAQLAEDIRLPIKMIPRAVSTTFLCLFIMFFGLSLALTLVYCWKYLPESVAIPKSYAARGITGSNYVIGVGGVLSLTASLLCSMYCLPRAIFALANDRLLIKVLSYTSEITRAPILASCFGGVVSATVAMLIRTETLLSMMSFGTLLSFGLTATCTLFLRYDQQTVGLHKEYEDLYESLQSTTLVEISKSTQYTGKRNQLQTSSKAGAGIQELDMEEELKSFQAERPRLAMRKSVSADTMSSRLESSSFVCPPNSHLDMQINQIEVDPDINSDSTKPILKDTRTKRKMYVMVQSPSLSSIITTVSEYTITPSVESLRVVKTATIVLAFATACMAILTLCGNDYLASAEWWAIFFLSLFIISITGAIYCISRQPKNHTKLLYSTSYMPFVPIAGIFLTIHLLVALPAMAWATFGVWLGIGLLFYIGYGIRHSKEQAAEDEDVVLYDVSERRSSTT